MARLYAGKPPSEEGGWEMLASPKDSEGMRWGVFIKRQEHSPDWVTCKIAAFGRVVNKANYWLAKNIRTGQIGFAKDYVNMRENRSELHALVEEILSNIE